MTAPLTTREALTAAIHEARMAWVSGSDPTFDDEALADALLAGGALVDVGKLAADEALVERVSGALCGSRLKWGTRADRWTLRDWQDGYWREAAQIALTALAAAPSAQSERAPAGEVACSEVDPAGGRPVPSRPDPVRRTRW